jgi:hypothetical protein
VQAILDEVPASARDLLKALRGLMRWAKRNGRIKVDPTAEVDPPPMEPSQGYAEVASRARCRCVSALSRDAA